MLKIIKVETDGHTGHITIHAQVLEKNGNAVSTGVVESHGIHPQVLKDQYADDQQAWVDQIHRDMLKRHEDRKIATSALTSLQGKTLLLDEEKHGNHDAPAGN